jgi:hypothetical protein
MLPLACHWTVTPDVAFLRYNCRGVAWVRRQEGFWDVTIAPYKGAEVRSRAATQEQGIRHVSRWVGARKGMV